MPELKAPFPWFGGKSRVANIVWDRFGNVANFVEPFFGSGAVLLGRPHAAGIETVNDLDCVAPDTKIWREDLRWVTADSISVGDRLIGFDESNGPARHGLRAPQRYRRWRVAIVTNLRKITKPCYRLTFDDGTKVVCSAEHQWLGGSHVCGGRGWRWQTTKNLRCDKGEQRSWICKITDVVTEEDSYESGWIAGFLDGEGNLKTTPGWQVNVSQKLGPQADEIECLLKKRNFNTMRRDVERNPLHHTQAHICVNGGMREVLRLLMQIRPERLIQNLIKTLPNRSLYGRDKQAVGLVCKEFIGEAEVIAIETDCHTFIAEGLASHNCMISNFWRALKEDPDEVAHYADWPVNEADQHARHLWLCSQEDFRERMKVDPDYYDAKIAGFWVWGQSAWIGSGWCSRQLPHLGDAGTGVHRPSGARANLLGYMRELSERLRTVRVCCGNWDRILGPSPTVKLGTTGVFLDPPYADESERQDDLYATDSGTVAHAVRAWAITNGNNPNLRIALCGYEGEHAMPEDWDCIAWKARGGYGSQSDSRGRANSGRERIWFSPYCITAGPLFQLFDIPEEAESIV